VSSGGYQEEKRKGREYKDCVSRWTVNPRMHSESHLEVGMRWEVGEYVENI
jgi:hypothetical protein